MVLGLLSLLPLVAAVYSEDLANGDSRADVNHSAPTFVLGFGAVTLLDFWALFVMVFDAKTSAHALQVLLCAARGRSLTRAQYQAAHAAAVTAHHASRSVAQGVGVLSYVSLAVFLAAMVSSQGACRWCNVVLVFIVTLREGMLLLLALPDVARVNELQQELSRELAEADWGVDSNGGGVRELEPVATEAELRRLSLWTLCREHPLELRVLGWAVTSEEVRLQLSSIAVVMAGSFMAYLMEETYRDV